MVGKDLTTTTTALQKFSNEELQLIKDTVAKDATDNELALFLYTAKLRGLNPLTRQVHFVKRGGQGTIQTGIDGFRLIAERTGHYAPSPKPTIFEYKNGQLDRATVFGMKIVGNQAFEYSATAKFSEYAQSFNGQLGNMWKKMPETMLEKCCEAKLLRKGFPEELSGLYTDEEMAQADSVGEIVIHNAEIPEHLGGATQTPSQTDNTIEAEVQEVTSDNPYANYLTKCPIDDENWVDGKWGKTHKSDAGSWHNLSVVIKDEVQRLFKIFTAEDAFEIRTDGGKKKTFTTDAFKGWLKAYNPDLPTWSKIDDATKIEILWELNKAVGEIGKSEDNPLVAEAKKLGAIVKEEK